MPWFVVGFFGLAAVNSFGLIPAIVARAAEAAATGLLATAVTATAIRSPLAQLRNGGVRPLFVIVWATAAAFVLALAAARYLVR